MAILLVAPMAPTLDKLTLVALVIAVTGCRRGPQPVAASAENPDGGLRPLTTLQLLWRLPGMEATQSLLTANPDGNIFLAVKQTGDHAWDLCAIDVRRGEVKWCSRLAQRADIALSVAADKAIAHALSGDLAAYDLATGLLSWRVKLDCEIRPGRLHAVGERLALAQCYREGIAASEPSKPKLVAIDLKEGKLRWQHAEGPRQAEHYLFDEHLLVSLEPEWPRQEGLARPVRRAPDRQHGRGYRLFLGLSSGSLRPAAGQRVGGKDSGWRILDLETGHGISAASLAPKTQEALRGDTAPVVARAVFSDRATIFDQDADGLKARPASADTRWNCLAPFHDAWSWMRPDGRIWRAGRLFSAGCDEVYEVDPASDGVRQSWPMAKDDSLPDPLLIFLAVAGSHVTFVLGSRDDRETGRIVTFDGQTLVSASRSPAVDPDLIALTSDVLLVQEQTHVGLDETPSGGIRRQPVLAGYSLADVRPEPFDLERSNTERIRSLVAPLGAPDHSLCSDCVALLDAKSTATLHAIPQWEHLLAALLLDRSRLTQEAAFAAVKQLRTPALMQALVRLLEPKATPGWSPWNRQLDWWILVAEKEHEACLQAAMALTELRHIPAIKPLTKLFLEAPIGDQHEPLAGRTFPEAFCSWIGGSKLPAAREAIADYDRAMNAPGAWQARCDALLRPAPPRPRQRSAR